MTIEESRKASAFDRLFARLESSAPSPARQTSNGSGVATGAERAPARETEDTQADRDETSAALAGATGDLWGVVEPCWRGLARASTVPVTLEVALDGQGRMATPPRILRTADARLDEPRLQSEARALSALAACMPRADLRFGGRVYRLDFRPTR